jgi:hypothetical protein
MFQQFFRNRFGLKSNGSNSNASGGRGQGRGAGQGQGRGAFVGGGGQIANYEHPGGGFGAI